MPIYPMGDCVQVTLSSAFQDVYVDTAWKPIHTVRAAASGSKVLPPDWLQNYSCPLFTDCNVII